MRIILAFSGAFILGLSFLHVLPESYGLIDTKAGVWVLVGFIIQIVLEEFSKGLEHGHSHALNDKEIPFALFFGLGIHSLLEGLPFGGQHAHEHHSLLAGVLVHKVPVAFILGTVLKGAGFSISRGALVMAGFAAMAPIGGLITRFMEGQIITVGDSQGIVLAILVGIFLHIATTIIFESDKGHTFNLTKLMAILLGFVLAFIAV